MRDIRSWSILLRCNKQCRCATPHNNKCEVTPRRLINTQRTRTRAEPEARGPHSYINPISYVAGRRADIGSLPMEALAATAAAAERADEAGDMPLDPLDHERGGLPSDDEDGPLGDDEEDEEDEEAEEAAAGGGGNGAAAGTDAAEPTADDGQAMAPPELPADVGTLKVDELKLHLWWRKLPQMGLKVELAAKLRKAIEDKVPLRTVEEARTGGGARQPAAGGAARQQWEPVDASKIDRPVYTGAEKFTPRADLGLSHATHPFTYMEQFYPKSVRDLEVSNSAKYRGYVKLHSKEVYVGLPDVSVRTNSLAHAMLLCQGGNPVPDQRKMWSRSFFFKAPRGADLMTREEWKVDARMPPHPARPPAALPPHSLT